MVRRVEKNKKEKLVSLSHTALLLAFALLLAGCGSNGTEPGEKRQPLPTAGLTAAVTETPAPTAAPTPTATPEPTPWLAYPKPEYALVKETTVSYEGNEEALLGTAEVLAAYTEDGYPLSFQSDTRTEEWSYETLEGSGEKRLLRYTKTEVDERERRRTETWEYSYDAKGRLAAVAIQSVNSGTENEVSTNSYEWRYRYSEDGTRWEISVFQSEELEAQYTYEDGICVEQVFYSGETRRVYSYDLQGNLLEESWQEDEQKPVKIYYQAVYSEDGELLRAYWREYPDDDGTKYTDTYYEAAYEKGKLLTETVRTEKQDGTGSSYTRTYLYDREGKLTSVLRNAEGETASWEEAKYTDTTSEDGTRTVIEAEYGPNGQVRNTYRCVYDARGQVIEEKGLDGVKRNYTYGGNGECLTVSYVESGCNVWEEYAYNEYGLPASKICLRYADGTILEKSVTQYEYQFFDSLAELPPTELGDSRLAGYIDARIVYRGQ